MSLDWGAVGQTAGWLGLGLISAGLIAQTVAGASLHKRPRVVAVGGGVLAFGYILLDSANESPLAVIGHATWAALAAPVFFWPNRLTKCLAVAAAVLAMGLYVHGRWNDGELAQALWLLGAVWSALAALIIISWLHHFLASRRESKPPRDAHA